jgi:hypothetical protein
VNQIDKAEPRRLRVVVALVLLVVRGVLLWLVVPLTVLGWLLAWPFRRRKPVHLAQLLGWMDLNLIAAIEHSILRPVISSPLQWTPLSALLTVSHRIGLLDLA